MTENTGDVIIQLDAGSGGKASRRLVGELFQKYFANPELDRMNDAALLQMDSGLVSMSTDSYTVTPLFFPGGSIGDLAVNGTVNDVAMLGATPLYLSCGFIIEEGLPFSTLENVVRDMAMACRKANVKIVTGDTKVVPHGKCDGLFINTTGMGHVYADPVPMGDQARPGDAVLVSGSIGDHGATIMSARVEGGLMRNLRSDTAPLADMIKALVEKASPIHVLRDPTRGGLATTLNEIAEQSGVCIEIEDAQLPVKTEVADACSILGIDPLYMANEGICIVILPADNAQKAIDALRGFPAGKNAKLIGKVTDGRPGRVLLRTRIGGQRIITMLEGAPTPRIC